MSDLFRREAIAHSSKRMGDVILRSTFPFQLLSVAVVVIVGALVLLACTATYVRRETVHGWLTPSQGLVRLTAASGGVVDQLFVREGDAVQAGQVVARMRLSQTLSAGDSFATVSRSLEAQRLAAASQARSTIDALSVEAERVRAEKRSLEEDLGEARRRVVLQRERVRLVQAEVERAEAIAAKGFLSGREVEMRRSNAIQAEQTLSEMSAAVLALERQLNEVRARQASIPLERRSAEAESATAAASLSQLETQSEAAATYLVVATRPGRVGALPIIEGETLSPGATLAILTPEGGSIEAEVYVPSRAAGFVREGQAVRLMYDAFPYQKFGTAEGRLATLSDTVLAPEEVPAKGLDITEPVFRARVRLDRQTLSAYGRDVALQPGMTLTADVQTDRRTLIEWLFDPIYAVGRR